MQETVGNYVAQLKYAEQAYNTISNQPQSDQLKGDIAIDLANAYLNFGNPEDAYLLFRESFQIHNKKPDIKGRSRALYGLANASYFMGELDSAKWYIQLANQDFKSLEEVDRLAQSYNLTGVILLDLNKVDSAEWHLKESLHLATQIKNEYLMVDALENLLNLYTSNNQPNAIEETITQLNALSITSPTDNSDLVVQQSLLESSLKIRQQFETQLNLAQSLIKRLRERFWLVIFLLIAVIIIARNAYLTAQRKKTQELANLKQEQEAERREAEKHISQLLQDINQDIEHARRQGAEEKLAELKRIVHNTIGSQLTATNWKLEPLIDTYRNQNVAVKELEGVMQMIGQTCQNSRNIERIIERELGGWIKEIEQLFLSLQSTENATTKIEFEKFGDDFTLPPGLGSQVYQIINIIVANTLKHADAKAFTCQLNALDDELIIITRDDGKGFEVQEALQGTNGTGVKNLHKIVDELDGVIKLDSALNKGTTITITIPLTA